MDGKDAPHLQAYITRPSSRAMAFVLFGTLFITFSYFIHVKPGWNVNTRIALTYALVEQKTFAIDAYHTKYYMDTGDKAFYKGRFYCDKSPALSFLAVPIYAALWSAKMGLGYMADMPHPMWVLTTLYACTVLTVGLCAALAGVLLWVLAQRFGASPRIAALLSFTLLCGTLLFGYATLFFPYLPSILCLLLSYLLVLDGRLREDCDATRSSLHRGMRLFWAGLLLGMAWFFDYTAGLVGIGIGAYALWSIRGKPWVIWKFIGGGLIPVAMLFAYTYNIFGEFSIPYKYEYDEFFRTEMQKGFQGIHWPRLGVLYYITIHPFKGVFFWSPVLLLWFIALASLHRNPLARQFRPDVLLSIYVVAAYLAFSSGYYLWWGGWAAQNRNFCLAIPFFAVPLAIWLARSGRWKLLAFLILAALSISANFLITAVDPQLDQNLPETVLMQARISDNYPSPIIGQSIPKFFLGDIDMNLGMLLLPLKGLWSLLPLLLIWIASMVWIARRGRKKE